MARDGTNRGGPRAGAGRKPKPLFEKIREGTADDAALLPEPAQIDGFEMPPVREYMTAKQKSGKDLQASQVFRETCTWLAERGCDRLVNRQLVEQYAMYVSRWIACEDAISEYGYLAKHPTTGNAIASPYVSMSQSFMKLSNQIWYQIYSIVKDNCTSDFTGANPQDDLMERLLRTRNGRQAGKEAT